MERCMYDLSHFSFMTGRIGQLQTLTCIPVVSGDSFSVNFQGVFRLSPLRRNMVIDCMVDLFAFYVPYRHVYGDDWENFMLQGTDETVTFGTADFTTNAVEYLGSQRTTGVAPLWRLASYNQIWNRYFRVPSDTSAILSNTALEAGVNKNKWGRYCARPKVIWSTGVDTTTDAADREVTVTANQLDITDLDAVKGRYASEQRRDWFGQRYNDILKNQFGGGAGTDADERPTLIMRKQHFLSGYDVDGTGDATLGQYSGKSAAVCDLQIPRKWFPEHGSLWIMALLRFPTIHEEEIHYLFKKSQPTYDEISGDPDIWERKAPIEHQVQDFFTESTDTTSLGFMPYGQWYRYHPNVVHNQFTEVTGFSFVSARPTSKDTARYIQDDEYTPTFQTTSLGHWQSQARVDVEAVRPIPGPLKSIFAGV
ncbi:putative major capsid protein [Eel River basin pequenovirus]|nr:putative major capsid protein [Eel River basin pequenovirus]